MTQPLTVLMSFPPPRPTSNPYNTLLMDAVAAQPDTRVRTFSWKRFLVGGYDVFHVHWPEILVNGQSYPKKKVRQLLFALGLLRLRITRTPLVRTLHNLELPRGISWSERTLLRWAERWTTHWIVINPSGEVPAGANVSIALHGHYRPWYAKYPKSERIDGRFGFFGMIRRYKNAVGLVKAFRELPGDDVSLRVCGRPSSDELAGEIRDAAGDDPRVDLVLDFLDDQDLVTHVTASQLIVLPYPEMHNSGSVFAALSLDRPVLVPDNEVNRQLADEVGADWVLMYDGDLTSDALADGLRRASALDDDARPDLSTRDWDVIGADHVAAYRAALEEVRPGGGVSRRVP